METTLHNDGSRINTPENVEPDIISTKNEESNIETRKNKVDKPSTFDDNLDAAENKEYNFESIVESVENEESEFESIIKSTADKVSFFGQYKENSEAEFKNVENKPTEDIINDDIVQTEFVTKNELDTNGDNDTEIDTNVDNDPECDTNVDSKPTEFDTNVDSEPAKLDTNVDNDPEFDTHVDGEPTKLDTNIDNDTEIDTNVDSETTKLDTNVDNDTEIDTNVDSRPTNVDSEPIILDANVDNDIEIVTNVDREPIKLETNVDNETTELDKNVDSEFHTNADGEHYAAEFSENNEVNLDNEIENDLNNKDLSFDSSNNNISESFNGNNEYSNEEHSDQDYVGEQEYYEGEYSYEDACGSSEYMSDNYEHSENPTSIYEFDEDESSIIYSDDNDYKLNAKIDDYAFNTNIVSKALSIRQERMNSVNFKPTSPTRIDMPYELVDCMDCDKSENLNGVGNNEKPKKTIHMVAEENIRNTSDATVVRDGITRSIDDHIKHVHNVIDRHMQIQKESHKSKFVSCKSSFSEDELGVIRSKPMGKWTIKDDEWMDKDSSIHDYLRGNTFSVPRRSYNKYINKKSSFQENSAKSKINENNKSITALPDNNKKKSPSNNKQGKDNQHNNCIKLKIDNATNKNVLELVTISKSGEEKDIVTKESNSIVDVDKLDKNEPNQCENITGTSKYDNRSNENSIIAEPMEINGDIEKDKNKVSLSEKDDKIADEDMEDIVIIKPKEINSDIEKDNNEVALSMNNDKISDLEMGRNNIIEPKKIISDADKDNFVIESGKYVEIDENIIVNESVKSNIDDEKDEEKIAVSINDDSFIAPKEDDTVIVLSDQTKIKEEEMKIESEKNDNIVDKCENIIKESEKVNIIIDENTSNNSNFELIKGTPISDDENKFNNQVLQKQDFVSKVVIEDENNLTSVHINDDFSGDNEEKLKDSNSTDSTAECTSSEKKSTEISDSLNKNVKPSVASVKDISKKEDAHIFQISLHVEESDLDEDVSIVENEEKEDKKENNDIKEQNNSEAKELQKIQESDISKRIRVNLPMICMERSICISQLNSNVRAKHLQDAFSKYGKVIGTKVFLTPFINGVKQIFAYIRMDTKEQARRAISKCNNSLIQGSLIRAEMVTSEMTVKRLKPLTYNDHKPIDQKSTKDTSKSCSVDLTRGVELATSKGNQPRPNATPAINRVYSRSDDSDAKRKDAKRRDTKSHQSPRTSPDTKNRSLQIVNNSLNSTANNMDNKKTPSTEQKNMSTCSLKSTTKTVISTERKSHIRKPYEDRKRERDSEKNNTDSKDRKNTQEHRSRSKSRTIPENRTHRRISHESRNRRRNSQESRIRHRNSPERRRHNRNSRERRISDINSQDRTRREMISQEVRIRGRNTPEKRDFERNSHERRLRGRSSSERMPFDRNSSERRMIDRISPERRKQDRYSQERRSRVGNAPEKRLRENISQERKYITNTQEGRYPDINSHLSKPTFDDISHGIKSNKRYHDINPYDDIYRSTDDFKSDRDKVYNEQFEKATIRGNLHCHEQDRLKMNSQQSTSRIRSSSRDDSNIPRKINRNQNIDLLESSPFIRDLEYEKSKFNQSYSNRPEFEDSYHNYAFDKFANNSSINPKEPVLHQQEMKILSTAQRRELELKKENDIREKELDLLEKRQEQYRREQKQYQRNNYQTENMRLVENFSDQIERATSMSYARNPQQEKRLSTGMHAPDQNLPQFSEQTNKQASYIQGFNEKRQDLQKLADERERITMEFNMLQENRMLYEQSLKMKLEHQNNENFQDGFSRTVENKQCLDRQEDYASPSNTATSSTISANTLGHHAPNSGSQDRDSISNVKKNMASYVKLLEAKNPNRLQLKKGKKNNKTSIHDCNEYNNMQSMSSSRDNITTLLPKRDQISNISSQPSFQTNNPSSSMKVPIDPTSYLKPTFRNTDNSSNPRIMMDSRSTMKPSFVATNNSQSMNVPSSIELPDTSTSGVYSYGTTSSLSATPYTAGLHSNYQMDAASKPLLSSVSKPLLTPVTKTLLTPVTKTLLPGYNPSASSTNTLPASQFYAASHQLNNSRTNNPSSSDTSYTNNPLLHNNYMYK